MRLTFTTTTLSSLLVFLTFSKEINAFTTPQTGIHHIHIHKLISTQLLSSSPSSSSTTTTTTTTKITNTISNDEKSVRRELNEKATLVQAKDEISYGASTIGTSDVDINGNPTSTVSSLMTATTTATNTSTGAGTSTKTVSLAKQMERMTKTRAYPLFIAEKVAIIAEQFLDNLTSSSSSSNESNYYYGINTTTEKSTKEKIVILGTGWGAAAFLKDIDTNRYDVTVISPRNYFLFTPMLAGASVGTVEFRSITESIREISKKANYLEGTATNIDIQNQSVFCESIKCEGNSCTITDFTVPYDKLILTVGAQTNTFGIPGVREHCCFLKQVEDARKIRNSIINCFERASLPSLTDQEKKDILTFCIIGAGPTGVEFASELRDFIEQDGPKFYPSLLKFVRIKVIEASPTVLAPFDKSLQEEAIRQLTRDVKPKDPSVMNLLPEKFKLTELLLNSGVKEVRESVIQLNDGREIPYGLSVWAAGNGPLPITLQLIDALGKESEQGKAQSIARGRVAIDPWLRVIGGEGKIFAYGDCSCITSGQLPATAQVASQQGEYLARLLELNYNMNPGRSEDDNIFLPPTVDSNRPRKLSENIAAFACQNDAFAAPFQFLNLGILAYTGGGSALAQLQVTPDEKGRVKGSGTIGFGLWRSVYLSKQISWRNRLLVFVDWTKMQIFGRDITRL